MAAKPKSATITVFTDDEVEHPHHLANNTDWAVIFDDVLEVKEPTGSTYYPLNSVIRWVVK